MDARIAAAGFLDADGFALPVELREVVQPQAAAEPTREGIEPPPGYGVTTFPSNFPTSSAIANVLSSLSLRPITCTATGAP